MFKVGDKVTRKPEFIARGSAFQVDKVYTIVERIPQYNGVKIKLAEMGGIWNDDKFLPAQAIMSPEPVPAGTPITVGCSLKVVESYRPAGLRMGDIVTVKAVHEKTVLLEEYPGKLFGKKRFQVIAVGAVEEKLDYVPLKKGQVSDGMWVKFVKKSTRIGYHIGDKFVGNGRCYKVTDFSRSCWDNSRTDAVQVEGSYHPHTMFAIPTKEEVKQSELAIAEEKKAGLVGLIAREQKIKDKIVPVAAQLMEALKKHGSGTSNSAYAFRQIGEEYPNIYTNAPCASYLNRSGPHAEIVVSVEPAVRGRVYKVDLEEFNLFLQYQLNTSPWAHCYITKDVKEAWATGIVMDCSQDVNQVMGAVIGLRDGYEHSGWVPTFKHFLDKGYHANVARMMSMEVSIDDKEEFSIRSWSMGHTSMTDDTEYEAMLSFFVNGFPDKTKTKPANQIKSEFNINATVGKQVRYTAGDQTFSNKFHAQLTKKQVGTGWDRKTFVDKDSVYALADKFQLLFKQKEA